MKILTIYLLAIACSGALAEEPRLTKAEVTRIGEVILGLPEYHDFKDGFDCEKPSYHMKEGIWSFPVKGRFFPVTVEATLYFFYVRDGDGYFRLGTNAYPGKISPQSAKEFRMPHSVREKLETESKNLVLPRTGKKGEQVVDGKPPEAPQSPR
jgi:hypothetical protein